MELNSKMLFAGFTLGVFVSYTLYKTPDCINKQIKSSIEKEMVAC